jgi:hypothetical protein
MEKQLIIDTFNADREYFMGEVAKMVSTAEVACTINGVAKAAMTSLVSEQGLQSVADELRFFPKKDTMEAVKDTWSAILGEIMATTHPKMSRKVDASLAKMDLKYDQQQRIYKRIMTR